MATAKKTAPAPQTVEIQRLRKSEHKVAIVGQSMLVTHKWSQKAIKQIRDKKAGSRSRIREVCVPEEEFEAATYKLEDGTFGVPTMSVKCAVISAAHKDLGVTKIAIRQGLFLFDDGYDIDEGKGLLRIHDSERVMREDLVRVVGGAPDLRYRPSWAPGWRLELRMLIDEDKLTATSVINLLERAGFGVGLCEGRPEKSGGEWGRFQVERTD